jgi:predicted GNAT family N-acyltransferase
MDTTRGTSLLRRLQDHLAATGATTSTSASAATSTGAATAPHQLAPEDREELLDFIDLVFSGNGGGHTVFEELLPQLYRPEEMHCQWAIRQGTQLMAVVGVFPRTLRVAGAATPLIVGGIGNVATHQRLSRGSGHMRTLMAHCVEQMRADGCDLAILGGQRQRYAYYGFEKCGTNVSFALSGKNVTHRDNFAESRAAPGSVAWSSLRFEVLLAEHSERMALAYGFYKSSSQVRTAQHSRLAAALSATHSCGCHAGAAATPNCWVIYN